MRNYIHLSIKNNKLNNFATHSIFDLVPSILSNYLYYKKLR